MRSLEESTSQRQKAARWLPGAGGCCLTGAECHFGKVLEMDGEDDCTTL